MLVNLVRRRECFVGLSKLLVSVGKQTIVPVTGVKKTEVPHACFTNMHVWGQGERDDISATLRKKHTVHCLFLSKVYSGLKYIDTTSTVWLMQT